MDGPYFTVSALKVKSEGVLPSSSLSILLKNNDTIIGE